MRRLIGLCVVAFTAGVVVCLGGGAASAESSDVGITRWSEVKGARAADDAGYIIVNGSDADPGAGGMFYPTGPIAPETLVVIANADGSLPGGMTEQELQERIAQHRAGEDSGSLQEIGGVEPLGASTSSYA